MLLSAVHHHESAIGIQITPPSWTPPLTPTPANVENSMKIPLRTRNKDHHTTQQSQYCAYTLKKPQLKKTAIPQQVFIAALFTKARTKKQPRCPLTDEWIKKLWDIPSLVLLTFVPLGQGSRKHHFWLAPWLPTYLSKKDLSHWHGKQWPNYKSLGLSSFGDQIKEIRKIFLILLRRTINESTYIWRQIYLYFHHLLLLLMKSDRFTTYSIK